MQPGAAGEEVAEGEEDEQAMLAAAGAEQASLPEVVLTSDLTVRQLAGLLGVGSAQLEALLAELGEPLRSEVGGAGGAGGGAAAAACVAVGRALSASAQQGGW